MVKTLFKRDNIPPYLKYYYLGIDTIWHDPVLGLRLQIISTAVLGKSPDNDNYNNIINDLKPYFKNISDLMMCICPELILKKEKLRANIRSSVS